MKIEIKKGETLTVVLESGVEVIFQPNPIKDKISDEIISVYYPKNPDADFDLYLKDGKVIDLGTVF